MSNDETPLQMTARHVRELEARIARQEQIVSKLDHDGHEQAAQAGRELLRTLRDTLRVAHEHHEIEMAKEGRQGLPG